jgi:F-type H+-transporting ATPase subunit delta
MGSQTRSALSGLPEAVASVKNADVAELFAVGRILAGQPGLVRALGDDSAPVGARHTLIDRALGKKSAGTANLMHHLVGQSWSNPSDLLEGIEEAGIRLAAQSAGSVDVAGELLTIDRVIKAQPDVQLALSGKRAPAAAKITMVEALFAKKVSAETLAIVSHLVAQPRNRRITQSISLAAAIVCDQRGEGLAEVRVASGLTDAHLKSIGTMLAGQYGRSHYIDQVIDSDLVGGIRIRVGDHVIDQSVATQLADMRRQLAS